MRNHQEGDLTIIENEIHLPGGRKLEVVSGLAVAKRLDDKRIDEVTSQVSQTLAANGEFTLFASQAQLQEDVYAGRVVFVLDNEEEVVGHARYKETYQFIGSEVLDEGVAVDLKQSAETSSVLGFTALKPFSRRSGRDDEMPGVAWVAAAEAGALAAAKDPTKAVVAVARVNNIGGAKSLKKAGFSKIGDRESWRNGTAANESEAGLIFHLPGTPAVTVPRTRVA